MSPRCLIPGSLSLTIAFKLSSNCWCTLPHQRHPQLWCCHLGLEWPQAPRRLGRKKLQQQMKGTKVQTLRLRSSVCSLIIHPSVCSLIIHRVATFLCIICYTDFHVNMLLTIIGLTQLQLSYTSRWPFCWIWEAKLQVAQLSAQNLF